MGASTPIGSRLRCRLRLARRTCWELVTVQLAGATRLGSEACSNNCLDIMFSTWQCPSPRKEKRHSSGLSVLQRASFPSRTLRFRGEKRSGRTDASNIRVIIGIVSDFCRLALVHLDHMMLPLRIHRFSSVGVCSCSALISFPVASSSAM